MTDWEIKRNFYCSDVLVKSSNVCIPVKPTSGKYYNRAYLSALVGGMIDTVPLGVDYTLIYHGGAKAAGRPVNMIATGWLNEAGIVDYICGDAVLIKSYKLRTVNYDD